MNQATCITIPGTAIRAKSQIVNGNKSCDTIIIVIDKGRVVRFDNSAANREFQGLYGDGI